MRVDACLWNEFVVASSVFHHRRTEVVLFLAKKVKFSPTKTKKAYLLGNENHRSWYVKVSNRILVQSAIHGGVGW